MRKYLEDSDKESKIFKEGKNDCAKKIIEELNNIYPDRRTAKQLHSVFAEKTRISLGDVHSKLNSLKSNGLIHELDKKQEDEFRKRVKRRSFPGDIKQVDDPKSAKYVIEDVSKCLHKSMPYQLAPGYFQYNEDFQRAWVDLILPLIQTQLISFQSSIYQILVNIFRSANINKKFSKIAPRGITEGNSNYTCSSCGIDHETRNFIRAIFLHLLDDFELSNEFIDFLWGQKIVNENGLKHLRIAHEEFIKKTRLPEAQVHFDEPDWLVDEWFEKLSPINKMHVEKIMSSKPEITKADLCQLVNKKKCKIGAGYLTDEGALFLVAENIGIKLR